MIHSAGTTGRLETKIVLFFEPSFYAYTTLSLMKYIAQSLCTIKSTTLIFKF